jgi:hypothetical protein
LRGIFLTDNRRFDFLETIERTVPGKLKFCYNLKSNSPVDCQLLALSLKIPAKLYIGRKVQFDKKTLILPEKVKNKSLFASQKVKTIRLATISGTLEISSPAEFLTASFQDDRFYAGNSTYDLRILFSPGHGAITQSKLALEMQFTPYALTSHHIAGKSPVLLKIDAAKNRPLPEITDRFVSPVRQESALNTSCKNAYLIHMVSKKLPPSTVVGEIVFTLANGCTIKKSIMTGKHAGYFRNPEGMSNGKVIPAAKQTDNKALIGAYLSSFGPLQNKINKVTIIPKHPDWKIASLLTGDAIGFRPDADYWIFPSRERQPIDFQVVVKPGSILDFSDLTEAPAGKHGRVVIRNGKFEFADLPGVPQKFYGANICFNVNYQTKSNLEKTIHNLRRMGYNTVRFHHFDRDLIDAKAPDSVTFNAKNLDRLDHLFYLAKKNGLYVAIDLYTLRPTKPGELKSLGGRILRLQEFKMFAIENDEVFENWKAFARKLLTHVNPYTKLAWKDDPALFNICLSNENNLSGHWNTTPASRTLFETAFKNEGGGTLQDFNRFLMARQTRFFKKASAYVRSLGCKVALTDMNMHHAMPLGLVRSNYDYVDNHIYHDHPKYVGGPGKFPNEFKNHSSTRSKAEVPRLLMPTRIFGKPFAVSEYNFCAPNRYRAESGPLMGAYSALQDYDVIQRFAYSHWESFIHNPSVFGRFDIVTDPISLFADRISVLLFRDGALLPGKNEIPLIYDKQVLNNRNALVWRRGDAPDSFAELGLVTQVGTVIADAKLPAKPYSYGVTLGNIPNAKSIASNLFPFGPRLQKRLIQENVIPAGYIDAKRKIFKSNTGQIELNSSSGRFKSVSPRTESFIINGSGKLAGNVVSVNAKTDWNVLLLASRDTLPLTQSKRMILIHLTNSNNLKARFTNKDCRTIIDPGVMPHLIDRGIVDIQLKIDSPEKVKVYAVSMNGARKALIPLKNDDGNVKFRLDTFKQGGTIAYEITKQ